MAQYTKQNAGCLGAAGGGVTAVFVLIRIIVGVLACVADSSHDATPTYDYSTYDYTPPTPVYEPPTIDYTVPSDPPLWQQDNPPIFPPTVEDPNPPAVEPPAVEDPNPPAVPPASETPGPGEFSPEGK